MSLKEEEESQNMTKSKGRGGKGQTGRIEVANRKQEVFKGLLCGFSKIAVRVGVGEMMQQLRALAVLPEDLGSNPSTSMETHYLQLSVTLVT